MKVHLYLTNHEVNTICLALYGAICELDGMDEQKRFMDLHKKIEYLRQDAIKRHNMMEGLDEKIQNSSIS